MSARALLLLCAVAASGCAAVAPAGPTITAIAVRPDGKLAAGGDDGVVRLCAEDGVEQARLRVGSPVTKMTYAPGGGLLAVAFGAQVRLCRPGDGVTVESLNVGREVRDLAFTPDGTTLVTADARGARLWDVRPGQGGALLDVIQEPGVSHVATALLQERALLATASEAGIVRFWDVETRALLSWEEERAGQPPIRRYGLPCGELPSGVALSSDGNELAFAVVRRDREGAVPRTSLSVVHVPFAPEVPERGWGWGPSAEPCGELVAGRSSLAPLGRDGWVWRTATGWDHAPDWSHGCVDWPGSREPEPVTTAVSPDRAGRVVTGGPAGRLALYRLGTAPRPEQVWERTLR